MLCPLSLPESGNNFPNANFGNFIDLLIYSLNCLLLIKNMTVFIAYI